MTAGSALAGVVTRLAGVFYGFLANYVNVTNVTDGDGDSYLRFALLPKGVELAEWAASASGTYAALLGAISRIPGIGMDLAGFFLIVLKW